MYSIVNTTILGKTLKPIKFELFPVHAYIFLVIKKLVEKATVKKEKAS